MNFAHRASCCYLIKITPPQVAEGFVLWFYFVVIKWKSSRPCKQLPSPARILSNLFLLKLHSTLQ